MAHLLRQADLTLNTKQNEAMVSQNLGISNLRLSNVIPARMSIKNLPTLEESCHKALLDYTQEGENNHSCAKSIRENNFNNYLLLTRKPVRIRVDMRRNVKISKENKKASCSITL